MTSEPRRTPSNPALSGRQRRNAGDVTKILYFNRPSGWVDWKIVTRAFSDEKARGFAKTKHHASKEAKAKQKEIEAEIQRKYHIAIGATYAETPTECKPKLARKGEEAADWSQK